MIYSADSNWLALLGESPDPTNTIRLHGHLAAVVQAALNAQYGAGEFKAREHGTIVTVWSWPAYRRHRLARGDSPEEVSAREQMVKHKEESA